MSGILAVVGLALLMWKRFLNAQLMAQQAWQEKMIQEFQDQQEMLYTQVGGDGETVDLLMQAPEYPQHQYSFGQSYPNPYWQNPGFAFAHSHVYHPELEIGEPSMQPAFQGQNLNFEQEIRIFTAIADRIRENGYMPSQNNPELN